jgi:hypothetical protein
MFAGKDLRLHLRPGKTANSVLGKAKVKPMDILCWPQNFQVTLDEPCIAVFFDGYLVQGGTGGFDKQLS